MQRGYNMNPIITYCDNSEICFILNNKSYSITAEPTGYLGSNIKADILLTLYPETKITVNPCNLAEFELTINEITKYIGLNLHRGVEINSEINVSEN
jgi:hypothetical protein